MHLQQMWRKALLTRDLSDFRLKLGESKAEQLEGSLFVRDLGFAEGNISGFLSMELLVAIV